MDSSSTANLELQFVQLDVQTFQKNREQDRLDFEDFRDHVQNNFQSLQKTLGEMQGTLSKFISGFPKPRDQPTQSPEVAQGSGQHVQTPQGPLKQPAEVVTTPAGSAVLVDQLTGKELNLDGSSKAPYRHPHFNQNKQPVQDPKAVAGANTGHHQQVIPVELDPPEDQQHERRTAPVQREQLQHNRRPLAVVKPAKYSIPEFDGSGTDSWIQTIEMYFEAARTPPEQKT